MAKSPLKKNLLKQNPVMRKSAIQKPKLVVKESAIKLPPDLVVAILLRLPAKSLSRLRSVCKSWQSLVEENWFAMRHMEVNAEKKNPGIMYLYYEPGLLWGDISLEYCEGGCAKDRFNLKDIAVDPRYSMTNSCNGLIGVFGIDSFFIVNPSIKKLIALPTGSKHHDQLDLRLESVPQAGLGFNDSEGEYKVVRLFCHQDKKSTGCEIFTLDGSKCNSWKVIGDAPLKPFFNTVPVVVNGAIHWAVANLTSVVRPEVALSFNICDETFGVILHPCGSSRPRYSPVGELDGFLCVSDRSPSGVKMDIWVLKDYRLRKWVKQYSIDLTTAQRWIKSWLFQVAPVTMWDGKIVLSDQQGRVDLYDPKSRKFREPESTADHYSEAAYHNESITWFWEEMITTQQQQRIADLRRLKLGLTHGQKGFSVWL